MTGSWHTPMALLTIDDVQSGLNIDLTDPNGQALAQSLIDAAVKFAEGRKGVGFPLEQGTFTTYVEDGETHFRIPACAPVTAVALSTYNALTYAYDVVSDTYIRWNDKGEVDVNIWLPHGFQAVKATYTAGWTAATLPEDLKRALINLIGSQILGVANYSSQAPGSTTDEADDESTIPTGGLKKYSVDGFTLEYSTAESDAYWKSKSAQMSASIGDDIPAGVLAVFESYRRPFAI